MENTDPRLQAVRLLDEARELHAELTGTAGPRRAHVLNELVDVLYFLLKCGETCSISLETITLHANHKWRLRAGGVVDKDAELRHAEECIADSDADMMDFTREELDALFDPVATVAALGKSMTLKPTN